MASSESEGEKQSKRRYLGSLGVSLRNVDGIKYLWMQEGKKAWIRNNPALIE